MSKRFESTHDIAFLPGEAEAIVARAVERLESQIRQAVDLVGARQWEQAIEIFEKVAASAVAPDALRSRAAFNRAVLTQKLGDAKGAVRLYEALISAEMAQPDDRARALCNLGVILASQDNYARAEEAYRKVLEGRQPAEVVQKALHNLEVLKARKESASAPINKKSGRERYFAVRRYAHRLATAK